MSTAPAHYYYACCQVGAEKTVKAEVIAAYPKLTFAFSRPGFLTFKGPAHFDASVHRPEWIFVRLWGSSIGQSRGEAADRELLKFLDSLATAPTVPTAPSAPSSPAEPIVHFFERDQYLPGDEPDFWQSGERLRQALPALPHPVSSRAPKGGDRVIDVIWIDPAHWFWGEHIHRESLDVAPGNIPPVALPESLPAQAPSRAYLKVAEAMHRFGAMASGPMSSGDVLVEIGCAPGGATSYFLGRGLEVIGIDPKLLDESIHRSPRFRLIQKLAKTITGSELGSTPVQWVAMDMNLKPEEALNELAHVLKLIRKIRNQKPLKGLLITLKLNDWSLSQEAGKYLARLSELNLEPIRAMQLCSNRQEFFVFCRDVFSMGAPR